jgi:hypothetical protein
MKEVYSSKLFCTSTLYPPPEGSGFTAHLINLDKFYHRHLEEEKTLDWLEFKLLDSILST